MGLWHLYRPLGQAIGLLLAFAFLLSGDGGRGDARARAVFLGTRSLSEFAAFETVLLNSYPDDSRGLDMRYVQLNPADADQMARSIQEALKLDPVLLIAPSALAAKEARKATRQVPIVFSSYPDPIGYGLIEARSYQQQAITGVSLTDKLHGKRIELLVEAFPEIRRLAVLSDRYWQRDFGTEVLMLARQRFGLQAEIFLAENLADVDKVMVGKAGLSFDAWYIPPTYIAYLAERQIIAHLQRANRPAMHATVAEVKAGAMMAYAQDNAFAIPAMADLVHRILNGEDAASIPVERPRRIVLAVRADAQFGGQRINPAVVRKADLVF